MAYMPKLNHIAGACALLFVINHAIAQSETQLSPVVVTGESNGLVSQEIQAGFGGKWIDQTKSVNSITREQIDKTMAQKVSEVVRNDASVQANYTPLGYYEGFSIRAFGLDYGTAYQLNGMPLAAEAHIPLENKERVEVIKGISGAETGVISPGGYINFVTKRPANINSVTIGYGERGTFTQAADYGRWLNQEKTLGIRLNAANESIRPYAKEATGDRQFVSASIDATISTKTKIETDFDYQKKKQFTQPGWQLLGGTSLPSINPEQVLAVQPWRKPVSTEQTNFGTRLIHELDSGWKLNTAYQISKILSSDNSSFPWGCPSTLSTPYPVNSNYFCGNGNFSISDFRSNQEIHQNQSLKAELNGQINHQNLTHQILIGSSYLERKIKQPNYIWTDAEDYSASTNINSYAYGSISTMPNGAATYLGSTSTPIDNYSYLHKQKNLYLVDSISGFEKFTTQLGIRFVNASESWNAYWTGSGSNNKNLALPSINARYKFSDAISNYISYSEGLELGGKAPLIATNNGQSMPYKKTQQYEVGSKMLLSNNFQASMAIFQLNKPYEYTTIDSANYGAFVQRGTQKHTGLELGLAGHLTNHLSIQSSAMAINAVTEGTGDQFDGKRAMNVSKFKASTFISYKLPNYEQTSLNGGWLYEGSKYAKRDNSVKVPEYHRFDAGLTQVIKANGTKTTISFYVENLLDKRYWRDVSEYLGDAYLIPGAPRIFRATAKLDFF